MTPCPVCGHMVIGVGTMCGFHTATVPENWATSNRIMCDFVHRRIVPAWTERPTSELDEYIGERAA